MSRNYEYDTAAIRAQARRIKLCRDKLAQDATPRLRTVQNLLEGEFLGCAANALDQRLEKERAELKLLEGEMQLLYVGLMRYADALEEADRQAAEALAGQ